MSAAATVLVLSTLADPPAQRTVACDGCETVDIAASCDNAADVGVVVVSGHSAPPLYLGVEAPALARAVACHQPELVVLDTCYGYSTPVLMALATALPGVDVVATPDALPDEGFVYSGNFWRSGQGPIDSPNGARVLWTRPSPSALHAAEAVVASRGPDALVASLRRVHPNLVWAPLEGAADVLVPVAPERFRQRP